jgi:hypothetical protein
MLNVAMLSVVEPNYQTGPPKYEEPGASTIKFITAAIYGFRNKLELLSLASLSNLI